jgi:hypothetical protein
MPIKICSEGLRDEVAWLCDNCWRLPDQVTALEEWLDAHKTTLKKGRYVADIGFSTRVDAAGGGAAISSEMMRTMVDLGISLFLSEYPGVEEN